MSDDGASMLAAGRGPAAAAEPPPSAFGLTEADFVLDSTCNASLVRYMQAGGTPQQAVTALANHYAGGPHIAELACTWLADCTGNDCDSVATDLLVNMAKESFSEEKAKAIVSKFTGTPKWMQDMLNDKAGRKLLVDLAESHPNANLLEVAVQLLCDAGHASEVMGIRASVRHFPVFRKVLLSGLHAALGATGAARRRATTALAKCAALAHESYWFAVRTLDAVSKKSTPHVAERCAAVRRALDAAAALRAGPFVLDSRAVSLEPATAEVPTTADDARLDDLTRKLLAVGGHGGDTASDVLFRIHANLFPSSTSASSALSKPRDIAPGGLRHHPRAAAALLALAFRPFGAASARDAARAIECIAVLHLPRGGDGDDVEMDDDGAENGWTVARMHAHASLTAAFKVCKRTSTAASAALPSNAASLAAACSAAPPASAAAAAEEAEAMLAATSAPTGCLALVHFARSLLCGSDVPVPMLAPADAAPQCAPVWDDWSPDDEGAFDALDAAAAARPPAPAVARPAAVAQLLCACAEAQPVDVAVPACEAAVHALWRLCWDAEARGKGGGTAERGAADVPLAFRDAAAASAAARSQYNSGAVLAETDPARIAERGAALALAEVFVVALAAADASGDASACVGVVHALRCAAHACLRHARRRPGSAFGEPWLAHLLLRLHAGPPSRRAPRLALRRLASALGFVGGAP